MRWRLMDAGRIHLTPAAHVAKQLTAPATHAFPGIKTQPGEHGALQQGTAIDAAVHTRRALVAQPRPCRRWDGTGEGRFVRHLSHAK